MNAETSQDAVRSKCQGATIRRRETQLDEKADELAQLYHADIAKSQIYWSRI